MKNRRKIERLGWAKLGLWRVWLQAALSCLWLLLAGCTGDGPETIGSTHQALLTVRQVNSGGVAVSPFSADQSYSGGNSYSSSSSVSTSGVANAAPAAVYQSERYGNQTYTFSGLTAGAGYVVRLHFAEIYFTRSGARVFDVAINGAAALSNFDIFASGGANKAVVRDFSTTATATGQIVVQFTSLVDNAKSSGIEILAGTASQPPTLTAVAANPSSVNGTSTNLSALATDDGGEPSLTYTWSVSGTAPGPVSFAPNGTNAAKASVATFSQSGSYTLIATVTDGDAQTATGSTTVNVTVPSQPGVTAYSINAGGSAVSPFAADQFFVGGATYNTSKTITTSGVTNAAPAAVYQSERWGNQTYTFTGLAAGAAYVVRLHFAEIYFTSSGARVFNVGINGTPALSNFDIFANAGANKALVRDLTATATAAGQIAIQFSSIVDNAKVSGIELLTSGASSQPPTVTTAAAANPNPVTGSSTSLSVLGADDGGEASLVYTWSTTGTSPGPVVFTPNRSNAAKFSVASFSQSGTYTLRATVTDAQLQSVQSDVIVSVTLASQSTGVLRVDPVNPRYFSDGTKIVYLTGSHTWQTLKDRALTDPPPPFDYNGFLDFLVARNHNYFRLWTWEQPHSWNFNTDNQKRYFAQFPWLRSGPGLANDGKPKFDFNQPDQTYFDRVRARVMAAGSRGIYVAITLFNGWDVVNAYNATDGGLPYQAGNNVNGIAAGGSQCLRLSDPAVTQVQEAYVKKMIDTVNDLDNVLYEIANESDTGAVPFQYHMIDVIKQYEATKPKRHPVGMSAPYPGTDTDLFNSNADWIAPLGRLTPGDGRKVILNDSDHSYSWSGLKQDGQAAQRAWAWETFTIGAAPVFMDPYLEPWSGRNNPSGTSLDPYWDVVRNALGHTRFYANRMDLQHSLPTSNGSSTGYCLANPGNQYLVYQPTSGSFTLSVAAGTYTQEWFDPAAGNVAQSSSVTLTSGTTTFTPPFSGDAVLFLYR